MTLALLVVNGRSQAPVSYYYRARTPQSLGLKQRLNVGYLRIQETTCGVDDSGVGCPRHQPRYLDISTGIDLHVVLHARPTPSHLPR